VRRTVDQSIKTTALMAIAIIFALINSLGGFGMIQKVAEPNRDNLAVGTPAIALFLSMPRARGRPRRGAGWYAADSRRKRQKKFERALTLAKRRRPRKSRGIGMPPMAYVEEIPPEESIQNYSESLLFMVSDNWDPPACFGADAMTPVPRAEHGPRGTPAEEFTPCFVEEETQRGIEENIREPPDEMRQQSGQREHQEEADAWMEAPPSSILQNSQDQPPLLHPEHLNLIFDVRSMVDDQIFRAICINQCLDMLYVAYSSATPRRQCPTCAQVYAIPVRRGKEKDDHEDTG
jgi:hypothetical protein